MYRCLTLGCTKLILEQNLRYKDYQLVSRPATVQHESQPTKESQVRPGLYETDTVSNFGSQMQNRGVYAWWRKAMGYAKE